MPLTSPRFSKNARLQAAAENTPIMKHGEQDREAVKLIQQALRDLKNPRIGSLPISFKKGGPDGAYGDETTVAMQRFQEEFKVAGSIRPDGKGDGKIGRNTMLKLDELFKGSSAPPTPAAPPPAASSALRTVTVWINAFIAKDVPAARPGELLSIVLTKGPHAGKTALPGPVPGFGDGYLTDQRSFSSAVTAKSRIHTEIEVDFTAVAPTVSNVVHRCDPTTRVRNSDGADLNTGIGIIRGGFSPRQSTMQAGSRRVVIDVKWASSNPVARGPKVIPVPVLIPFPTIIPVPNIVAEPSKDDPLVPKELTPDIDLDGTLTIDADARTVEFEGKVDEFPFFEAYASGDGGKTAKTLFRIAPTPGQTPWGLPGPANRDVIKIPPRGPRKVAL